MTDASLPIGSDRDTIENLISSRYGLSVSRWMLDIVTSIRGRSGSLPIAAEVLASSLGIKLVEELNPAGFGSTHMLSENEFRITVASGLGADNRNFTIAHELGHIFFLKASNGQLTDGRALERFCDLFGAYLLAPIQFVHKHLRTRGANIKSIAVLAKSLDIPQQALWKLLGEHYPMSFWWTEEGTLDWIGQFDLKQIEESLRSLSGTQQESIHSRVIRPMSGIAEWSVEAFFDETTTYGLVKPAGPNVQQRPLVKSINVPRERLLSSQTGDWYYSGQDYRIAGEFE